MKTAEFILRRAERTDASALLRLICALAEYEKLEPPDAVAQGRLIDDAFGEPPRFEAWLACVPPRAEPVGYAITFETYSSFLARPTLYLEDVFVLPEFRGRGIGSGFMRHFAALAQKRGCGRMEWTCLDWNTKAQAVYEGKVGARRMSEWWLYRMTGPEIAQFLNGSLGPPDDSGSSGSG